MKPFVVHASRDPTHGYIKYVSQAQGMADGIVGLDAATGQVRMSVSGIANKTVATGPRDSIRLTSKATFQSGRVHPPRTLPPKNKETWRRRRPQFCPKAPRILRGATA